MIAFWAFVLAAVALLDRVHRGIGEDRVERHRFHLYAIRDELREAAMRGDERPSNWVFEYLDSSIAKTIGVLPTLSIWSLLFVVLSRHDDQRVRRAVQHLERELEKPSNTFLRSIHDKYIEAVGSMLIERHASARAIVSGFQAGGQALRWWQEVVELSTEAPETSTLQEFA